MPAGFQFCRLALSFVRSLGRLASIRASCHVGASHLGWGRSVGVHCHFLGAAWPSPLPPAGWLAWNLPAWAGRIGPSSSAACRLAGARCALSPAAMLRAERRFPCVVVALPHCATGASARACLGRYRSGALRSRVELCLHVPASSRDASSEARAFWCRLLLCPLTLGLRGFRVLPPPRPVRALGRP